MAGVRPMWYIILICLTLYHLVAAFYYSSPLLYFSPHLMGSPRGSENLTAVSSTPRNMDYKQIKNALNLNRSRGIGMVMKEAAQPKIVSVATHSPQSVVTGINLTEKTNFLNKKNIFNGIKISRMYKSCAVVGSSPILLGKKYGQRINMHDGIFRGNIAPTTGYEADVGNRTSARICCCTWLTDLNEKCNNMKGERLDYVISKLRYYGKGMYNREYSQFQSLRKRFSRMIAPSYEYVRKLNQRVYATSQPQELSTGVLIFSMALELCTGTIDVYGFDTEETHVKRRDGKLIGLRYNYFEYNQKPSAGWKKTPHRFAQDTKFICSHPRSNCITDSAYSPDAFE